jgi:hypothetical protein
MNTRMKALMASAVAMTLGLSSPAYAGDLSAGEMLARIDRGERESMFFLVGIAAGIEWSDSFTRDKLFCQPAKLTITPEQNVQMLRDLLQAEPSFATYPPGMVVLTSYKRTFPCPSKTG